jgi:hypothetical protein
MLASLAIAEATSARSKLNLKQDNKKHTEPASSVLQGMMYLFTCLSLGFRVSSGLLIHLRTLQFLLLEPNALTTHPF